MIPTRMCILALAAVVVVFPAAAGARTSGDTAKTVYALSAIALLGADATDISLTVTSATAPAPEMLEKVQVKAWPVGDGNVETRNFFDVPAPDGVAMLQIAGVGRGDRLQIRVHVKDGRQHNLATATSILRRPDLAVTRIDLPDDVVRTRAFDVTASVAEVGGDVGADARVTLFDGPTAIADTSVTVEAGATTLTSFRIALAEPQAHTLRAVVSASLPAEWDVAPNQASQEVYVNHYDANGVVATDHPLATQIGVDVLREGGNAFDAAAAVQFALNVTQPHLSGIGGGSNVLVRVAETGQVLALDARETAPAATTPTTYSGLAAATVRPNGFAVGVPGTVRAVDYLLDRWGTTSLADALDPAIALAEGGFPIGFHLARDIAAHSFVFQPETREIFLTAAGTARPEGDTLYQPGLAKTLRLLARDGATAFYHGEIAKAIVAAQLRATTPARAGTMALSDLAAYTIDVEEPLDVAYGGYQVLGAGPSTNGGVVLLESLGLTREFLADPENTGYTWGFGTRNSLHVFVESMRLAFADRDWWVGDDRYTNVPVAGLLDPVYLRARSASIKRETVMCNPVPPGNPLAGGGISAAAAQDEPDETGHTTHFSIIDRWGNAVVMTSTLADSFGTGITVPGYGFQLNDSLRLFNLQPVRNQATGNPGANDAAGGKRPMGSMAPTLILKDGEPFAGTGSFGATFIPSVVLNVVLNLIEYDLPLQQAIDAPRIWMQLANGDAQLNFGLDHLITPLRDMGHVAPAFGGCAGNVNRTPLPQLGNLGSTGSFGVNLGDFGLVGGVDGTRFPDARTVIVERG